MLTKTLWSDAAVVYRVDGPVVILQHVHKLEDSANPANCVVDGCCANELGRKIRV